MIIGITGTNGAGKGTVADYLISQYSFTHYSVREFLEKKLREEGKPVDRKHLQEKGNELRKKYGNGYVVEELYKLAQGKNAVIESIRHPREVEGLRNKDDFLLFAVDAHPQVRYRRIKQRQSATDIITFEDFLADDTKESKSQDASSQNINGCMALAHFLLENDFDQKHLYEQVNYVLEKRGFFTTPPSKK